MANRRIVALNAPTLQRSNALTIQRPPDATMQLPLEDNFTDVLGKAKRGLKLSDAELAKRASVAEADLHAAVSGTVNDVVLRKLAGALELGADALLALAKKTWFPTDPGSIAGFACFTEPYGETSVNSYLLGDGSSRAAAAFDTGIDCRGMLQFAAKQGWRINLILLTHAHEDHVADLARLKSETGAPAWASKREPVPSAEAFPDGKQFHLGAFKITTRRTSGHARGGVTYVVDGLTRRLAIVGDAIFAGSMGGGSVDYQEALRSNRENILSLPEDTVLCPGHGPLTTVEEEKRHNPFFT